MSTDNNNIIKIYYIAAAVHHCIICHICRLIISKNVVVYIICMRCDVIVTHCKMYLFVLINVYSIIYYVLQLHRTTRLWNRRCYITLWYVYIQIGRYVPYSLRRLFVFLQVELHRYGRGERRNLQFLVFLHIDAP